MPRFCPTVYESPEISGRVHETAAQETGLPAGIPVAAGAGDNAASAIGTGVVTDCRSFLTLGTSGVIDTHSDTLRVDPQGRVHTFCAAVPGAWLIVASVQSAGLSMQWMRNLLFPGDSDYAQVNQAIASVPIGAQRLLYLPYLMGDRSPHMDPDARGVFFGLSSMHTREHLARAVMEGISYGVRDCYGVLQSMGVMPQEMLLCGGGARVPSGVRCWQTCSACRCGFYKPATAARWEPRYWPPSAQASTTMYAKPAHKP